MSDALPAPATGGPEKPAKKPKAPKKPKEPKPPKAKTRYGIAEWYGRDMTKLTPNERKSLGAVASTHKESGPSADTPVCPFLSLLIPNAKCNKAGGVCSIRRYTDGPDATVVPVTTSRIVTCCPNRFIQEVEPKKSIFVWVSEKMLDITDPIIVKETPFLRKISDKNLEEAAPKRSDEVKEEMGKETAEEKKAGRIDWILVRPNTVEAAELEWCALETQAIYFSGRGMPKEFAAIAASDGKLKHGLENRRPDYRSCGPKRLAPQLDVKQPVLRNWFKKVAVLVDRFFFEQMNKLPDAYPAAKNDTERRDNAEVIWFVVDYDAELNLRPYKVIYTTLDSSRKALNATEPLSKADFTTNLRAVIAKGAKSKKVFTVSGSSAPA